MATACGVFDLTITLEEFLRGKNIYGRSLVKIPTPRFAVFYNGDEEQPEQYELKLSDAYVYPVENPELELVCRVYNINYGKNRRLLEHCPFLRDYMIFVDYVRYYHKKHGYNNLEHCIELAIDRCIEENVLRDFLMCRRTEVVKVMKLDYTFDRQLMLEREDSRQEGREEGNVEKLVMQICKKLKKNKSMEEIAEDLEEEISVIEPICRMAEQFAPEYDWQRVKERVLEKDAV